MGGGKGRRFKTGGTGEGGREWADEEEEEEDEEEEIRSMTTREEAMLMKGALL